VVAESAIEFAKSAKDGNVSDAERAAWRKSPDKHLSPEDLAEREGVPVQTIYSWNKTGTGPRVMKIGRHCRYRLADVIAWEDSRTVPGLVDRTV
jgi:predicted DNA-binding transcriptional regulator AlpA